MAKNRATDDKNKRLPVLQCEASRESRRNHAWGRLWSAVDRVNNMDPNRPMRHAVQNLFGADPTQETSPRSCRLYGFDLGDMS